MKELKEMKERLSRLSDDERLEELLEIYHETKKGIIKNEGRKNFNSDGLIVLISKEIGNGYNDYLAISASLRMDSLFG